MLHPLWHSLQRVYQHVARPQEAERTRALLYVLRRVPVFQYLPQATLRTLIPLLHQRTYRCQEVLYYEGDPGLGMYIILQGTVRLLIDAAGTPHELARLGEYDTCGHLALLGAFRRLETAQAVTDVQVLGFFRPDLKLLLKRHPAQGANVLQALARYVAARQVELVRVLAACADRPQALRWWLEAGRQAERQLPSLLTD
ncbi:Crp/Fnr family transcriptional regulator [Rhodothermus bifroesti]|uniref:Cyclic nucleotide-binding domain-containing protein n=1 Tax=Rhodothermus marinus TaxID=29549 RepID=A0A7V2B2H7_RHOMR|nr:cyclic nucleotide-binding domain-containing protein [Rhodothermus bifroesti]GBD01099.1 Cyclic AMP receptor protein [bacterium HR18]